MDAGTATAATLWFAYAMAVTPDGQAHVTPNNTLFNAPTQAECLDVAHEWATDLAADAVGPLTFYGFCLELDAALAGTVN